VDYTYYLQAETAATGETEALDVLAVVASAHDGDLHADYYDGNPVLVGRAGVATVDARWPATRPWVVG
jgi:hypothetical protein